MPHTDRVLSLIAVLPAAERDGLFDCAHAPGRTVSLVPGSAADHLWQEFVALGWAERPGGADADCAQGPARGHVYRVTRLGARAAAVLACRFAESRATGHPL